jgi:hypothetical protein
MTPDEYGKLLPGDPEHFMLCPDYRLAVALGDDRGFSKSNETALRFLLVRALDLRVSGSMQI